MFNLGKGYAFLWTCSVPFAFTVKLLYPSGWYSCCVCNFSVSKFFFSVKDWNDLC